jgi:hypothetical protein
MDVESLMRLCASAEEGRRLGLYKRIADVCLFTLGMFPEYLQPRLHDPAQPAVRLLRARRGRRSAEEYEQEGRRFYRMAGEHPAAASFGLAEAFWLLHERFAIATKPLSFIARHYLAYKKQDLFSAEPE